MRLWQTLSYRKTGPSSMVLAMPPRLPQGAASARFLFLGWSGFDDLTEFPEVEPWTSRPDHFTWGTASLSSGFFSGGFPWFQLCSAHGLDQSGHLHDTIEAYRRNFR
jgi:hypothetical protein